MLRDPAAIIGIEHGNSLPQGATFSGEGANFALYSETAQRVELCLYDDARLELARVQLSERTDNLWHGYLSGIGPGQRYGYRVYGAHVPELGLRFNPRKLLVDPYALALDRESYWHPALQSDHVTPAASGSLCDSGGIATCSVVVDRQFDWQGVVAPQVSWRDTVIYECHVKGMTQLQPDVPSHARGKYLGLCAPSVIEHWRTLGVTTIELLPVHHAYSERSLVERGLRNYWGYNTLGFFAPDARFAGEGTRGEQVREFKTMVRELHRAGFEVILDVVYNHSAEADALGPTLSLRGIDNATYYRLDPTDPSAYWDTTGCGNSLNFDHPQTQRLVMDSLRYWVSEMHVDGFRFDLAPTLARGKHGLDVRGKFFAMLAQDPLLCTVKLIVEPWDCGEYGVCTGAFGPGFREWNDRYRDSARRFFRGDSGQIASFVTSLAGSSNVFEHSGRGPTASINFVTSHDGRSLRDLVTYEAKYNLANGWSNTDGSDNEYARNFGVEGESADPELNAVRERTMRSWLLALACSQGVPMLRQGDEFGQSVRGNNNPYPQDNALSWLAWSTDPAQRALCAFLAAALAARRAHPELRRERFFSGALQGERRDVTWLHPTGSALGSEDFGSSELHGFGMWIARDHEAGSLLLLVNGGDQVLPFRLPTTRGDFVCLLDSAEPQLTAPMLPAAALRVAAHGCMLLIEQSSTVSVTPSTSADIARLASAYGIADGYIGYNGDAHRTSDKTRRALLAAVGCDVSNSSAIAAALRELDQRAERPGLSNVRVLGAGSDALDHIELTLPVVAGTGRYRLELTLETGAILSSEGALAGAAAISGGRFRIPLPAGEPLPVGYHGLRLSVDNTAYEQQLIITPRAGHSVADALGPRRGAGLWTHVYALHREAGYGVGDLGDLRAILQLANDHGLDFVGINPLHAADNNASVVSPYYPLSRLFNNPIYLEIEAVPELAHSQAARAMLAQPGFTAALAALHRTPRLDYARTWQHKRQLLHALHVTFVAQEIARQTPRAAAYAAFCREQGAALSGFATFCAIGEHLNPEHPVCDFYAFPSELRDHHSPAVQRLALQLSESIAFHTWLQFELDRQLAAAQDGARAHGMPIGIYADLAVGNAPGGADSWATPELFARGVCLGAPPDAYSATGQSWGLAPLLPRALASDSYRYFRLLCRNALRHAGMLRIDHVMGILRQFWVPEGRDARQGAYVRFPFEALCGILALESQRSRTLLVGEDLGVVPAGLRERMAELELLRSQVACFERDGFGAFIPPKNYAKRSLATLNTHDMAPLLAYFTGQDLAQLRVLGILADANELASVQAQRDDARKALLHLLAQEGLWLQPAPTELGAEFTLAAHQLLARTEALLVAAALDDICLETESLNVPGIASAEHPAWSKRMRMNVATLARDPTVRACLEALRQRPALES